MLLISRFGVTSDQRGTTPTLGLDKEKGDRKKKSLKTMP